VSPWWSIRTRDTTLFHLLRRDGYWPWALRLGMLLLLDRGGYWHCDPWFFVLFWTMTGITKFYKLWPKIYYHWLLGHDGYYHFPRIMTKASFLSFLWQWRILPCIYNIVFLVLSCICNIVFLCILDNWLMLVSME
jgi:hypothetical protein